MKVFENPLEMQKYSLKKKLKGKKIGLVPTMGALHEGHFSLVKESLKNNDVTVVSIFVNPTQFGPNEDLDKYPRTLEADLKSLKKLGVSAVFLPVNESMYSPSYSTWVNVEELTGYLCGKSRPNHFRGVTTVVSKLFNICLPDNAYFGQKDLQQTVIIKRMTEDLNFSVKIKVCPIIREKDGLALSSRNKYLDDKEREDALVLQDCLKAAKKAFVSGTFEALKLKELINDKLKNVKSAKIDYVSIVDGRTLKDVDTVSKNCVIALAVFIGTTRLIDNVVLK
jgi:pantoate--beta-alanine ligase